MHLLPSLATFKRLLLFIVSMFYTQFALGEKAIVTSISAGDALGLSFFSKGFDPDTCTILTYIYDSLLYTDLNGKLKPSLAESWKQINPTTYEFVLRQGVKFHDGSELTAKDVKFTYETVLDPKVESGHSWILSTIANVNIINDYKFQIVTKMPDGMLLFRLTVFGAVHSMNYVQKVGFEKADKHPIGSGPFRFINHQPGVSYTFEANKNYWRKGIPSYDKLIFKLLPEAQWADALISGDVNYLPYLPGTKTLQISKDPKLAVSKRLTLRAYMAGFRNSGPLADVRVRKAANYAIDREKIVAYAEKGNGKIMNSFGRQGEFGQNEALQPYSFDLVKARQLMREAGYEKGFKIKAISADETSHVAKIIKVSLQEIGIEVDLEIVTFAEFIKRVVLGKMQGKAYDIGLAIYPAINPIINMAFGAGVHFFSQSPWSVLNSKEFDQKFQWALTANTMDEHEARLKELDKFIQDQAFMIFTLQKMMPVGHSKNLTIPGIHLSGMAIYDMVNTIKFNQ